MFIDNKYTSVYNRIVQRAQNRLLGGYTETHHITPRCMGGTDDNANLVKLTSREHYICHALLVRMVAKRNHLYKMMSAFNMMHMDAYGKRYTSRLYEYNKHKYYKLKSEIQKGYKRTEESKQKQSAKTKGRPWTEKKRNAPMNQPTAKPVVAYDKKTGERIGEWESISAAGKALGCDITAVWKICEGKISTPAPNGKTYVVKSHKGYTFKYKDDNA